MLGDPAGNNALKMREVWADIEGKSMVGDPSADGDADGGDFAVLDPNACFSGVSSGGKSDDVEGVDEGLLEVS